MDTNQLGQALLAVEPRPAALDRIVEPHRTLRQCGHHRSAMLREKQLHQGMLMRGFRVLTEDLRLGRLVPVHFGP